ncbi:hypothetical protein QJS04_geneDACA003532 [Acorus gramineus]|uniref:Uncharacterized protein n=1 Tax=Acorus gramineus TaxID=55184 RepID=A0AAV9BQD0_ACOGR|nr:hypothetical protein QJS04_geneDACA003532 [Acorus gramineus]
MGVSSSKIEEDKALTLCRERKRFVRQALDGRCALAAAHVSYIQSLRNTGTALRMFVEPEAPIESSLYTSTPTTTEPLALTDKSLSQFTFSSPSPSQRMETTDTISPSTSPTHSGLFHINYMRSGGASLTVKERPPISVTATVQSSETPPFTPTTPPPPENGPWDYFSLFDNHISFTDGGGLNLHGLENVDDNRRLREEEGIPELEDEDDKPSINGRVESMDSEDDFDDHSPEPLVRKFENRAASMNYLNNEASSVSVSSMSSTGQETTHLNGEKKLLENGVYETDGASHMTPPNSAPPITFPPDDDRRETEKAPGSEKKSVPKDFFSSVKEIEYLFVNASEFGKEVPRMLEANKVHFRPLYPEGKEPPSDTVKYLTWHRSVSSLSSTSRIPLSSNPNDNLEGIRGNMFATNCMNSGSHASTLDRLYAWERKLYDEVKASGIIRREYDLKCKQLRHQESREESTKKIDKTRATVKDLYSRIRVAIHRIDSVSKRIEELRDKELQPQLEESIEGLSRMWVKMFDSHELQHGIISAAVINGTFKVPIQSESRHQAAIVLEQELTSLCSSFKKCISAQRTYLQSINGWLLKCVLLIPLRRKSSRRGNNVEFSPRRQRAPPIFVTCRDWLAKLEKLEAEAVTDSIKKLVADMNNYLPRQETSKSHFSLPRKADRDSEVGTRLLSEEAPVDWNAAFDELKSNMTEFLDRLRIFADSSVKMYGELSNSISEARIIYEQGHYTS